MRKLRFLGLILILFLCGVSIASAQSDAKTTVEVRNSTFYLNGIAVKLPVAAADLEKIIGKPDRTTEGVRKVATWDKLGLTGYQKVESGEYIEVGVILNVTDTVFPFTPKNAFSDSMIVDGARVTAASTRNSVNQKKKGGKFKPLPFVGMLSDYKTGGLYLVMWQKETRGASGSGKILQINIGIDPG